MYGNSSLGYWFNIYLITAAIALGFRHGLDWDHIAAIGDITGGELALTSSGGRGLRILKLVTLYSFGHLSAIAALAIIARIIASRLPAWLDPIMERVVGATLLAFGLWLFASIMTDIRSRRVVRIKSRWMLIAQLWQKILGRKSEIPANSACPSPAALSLGFLHGIGAETCTQVILLSALCPADIAAAVTLLLAFSVGLLISGCVVSLAMLAGSATALKFVGLSELLGVSAALFSGVVGAFMLTGRAEQLPKLFSVAQTSGGL